MSNKEFLQELNNHMDKNPSYPGDWYKLFLEYCNKNGHSFKNSDEMILYIGSVFRENDDTWCRENITGYSHSENNKNNWLSKSQTIYDEDKEKLDFWCRFLGQMLIYRYG
jgi:hypothetical protein